MALWDGFELEGAVKVSGTGTVGKAYYNHQDNVAMCKECVWCGYGVPMLIAEADFRDGVALVHLTQAEGVLKAWDLHWTNCESRPWGTGKEWWS